MKLENFKRAKGYLDFIQGANIILKNTLEEFFSASVRLQMTPLDGMQFYKIDVTANPNRNVYILSEDKILLLSSYINNNVRYYLGIEVTAKKIGKVTYTKIFNYTANAISNALTESYSSRFRKSVILLNENLIIRIIAKYVSSGHYNPYKVYFLIEQFTALRNTTFEGKYFSTGLIVTKSMYRYGKYPKEKGNFLTLQTTKSIYAPIDNRFWYLADGYTSFYMSNYKSDITQMLILNEKANNYIDKILLKNILQGGDFLVRVHNGREISIITSDGIEFLYQENTWRFRDYNWIKNMINSEIIMDDSVYNAVMFHVLNCSKSDTSSIIWIPQNDKASEIESLVKSKHSFAKQKFYIQDIENESLISRFLSSDGATVINNKGEVRYYGCIIDLKKVDTSAVKGTGETAAAILAKNGIAFKISQDGIIKLFLNEKSKVVKF